MSSHHFVKEGQEPALFIVDALSQSQADSILEWSPLVMVHEQAVEDVLLWGIKIDVVLAHSKNVQTLTEQLADQAPVKIIADANPDDMTTALWLLVTLKQSAVYVIVNDPEPIFSNANLPFEHIQINLVTQSIKWSHAASGIFKKWLSSGTQLYFKGLSVQTEMTNLTSASGHFEVTSEGLVEIISSSSFWVGEVVHEK